MTAAPLSGGFADPALDAARGFRALMEAMARPGSLSRVSGALPPGPAGIAAGVALLVLTDDTTPLHLAGRYDTPALQRWIRFHTGAPLVPAEGAQLALGRWEDLQPVTRFSCGDPAWPDRSATLIVEVDRLDPAGPGPGGAGSNLAQPDLSHAHLSSAPLTKARLTGPGIAFEAWLALPEIAAFRANRARYPLGFDTILTSGDWLACLPRSTHVEQD